MVLNLLTFLILIFIDDIKEAVEWLRNHSHSPELFEIIKEKWIITHEIRKAEFKNKLLSDIFDSWTILKGPRGHELVSSIF